MQIITDRTPKGYRVNGTVFQLTPASKDDMSKAQRASLYEMEHGDRTEGDAHLFEMNIIRDHLHGWDETLIDSDEKPIPYSPASVAGIVAQMDQGDRNELFFIITSPAKNRAKRVAAEKNA